MTGGDVMTSVMVPEPCDSCQEPFTELMRTGDLRVLVTSGLRDVLNAAIKRFGVSRLAVFCRGCGDFGVLLDA